MSILCDICMQLKQQKQNYNNKKLMQIYKIYSTIIKSMCARAPKNENSICSMFIHLIEILFTFHRQNYITNSGNKYGMIQNSGKIRFFPPQYPNIVHINFGSCSFFRRPISDVYIKYQSTHSRLEPNNNDERRNSCVCVENFFFLNFQFVADTRRAPICGIQSEYF